ncbi:MAG: helix-turn-helix domain-containing protein [Alphaproteobacteria bacterium]
MQLNTLPQICTPKEVADFLKVNKRTIINLCLKQQLKGFKVGREWRINKDSIEDYIQCQENQACQNLSTEKTKKSTISDGTKMDANMSVQLARMTSDKLKKSLQNSSCKKLAKTFKYKSRTFQQIY